MTKLTIPYRVYKSNFAENKVVEGSYNDLYKTITVLFTAEQMKQKTNLGNYYRLNSFDFAVLFESGNIAVCTLDAKTFENAIKNFKRKTNKGLNFFLLDPNHAFKTNATCSEINSIYRD